jgi:CRP-like cAMP-binding protein
MGIYVIFTNNSISKEKIINYDRPTALKGQELFISVSHDYSPTRVKKVLLNTIMGVAAVQKTPATKAYLVEYCEYHIKYRVKYWIRDYVARLDIQDAIMTHFWFALRRAKIALPVPVREVNMRAVAADDEEQKQSTLKNKIIDMLSSLPFLEELNNKQLEVLAEAARLQKYTINEALVRQGEEGDSLFIIKSGEVTIYVHNGEQPIYVAERGAGDFFGEMSLLTGESRSASVIAKTETEVVTIDKEAFANVLTTDRMILELMLDALEKRRSVLLEKLASNVKDPQQQELSKRQLILNRITHFLGISLTS